MAKFGRDRMPHIGSERPDEAALGLIEQWIYSTYSGSYAAARPEWSKGWAYTDTAAWRDDTMLSSTIAGLQSVGQPAGSTWEAARSTLNRYDPYRVFSSPLLDRLLA